MSPVDRTARPDTKSARGRPGRRTCLLTGRPAPDYSHRDFLSHGPTFRTSRPIRAAHPGRRVPHARRRVMRRTLLIAAVLATIAAPAAFAQRTTGTLVG